MSWVSLQISYCKVYKALNIRSPTEGEAGLAIGFAFP